MNAGAVPAAPAAGTNRRFFTGFPIKVSWSGIFAGVVTSLGIWILLYALGIALGLSTVDPNAPSSLKASGIFTGIWSLIVPLIALFVGGFVAARGGSAFERGDGAIHGLVVWGFTTVAGVWLMTSAAGAVISGLGGIGKTAVEAATGAAKGGGTGGMFDLDASDALKPINERLRAEGKPEVTTDQLQLATRSVLGEAVRTGSLDRQTLTAAIAQNSELTQQDADEIATRVQEQFDRTKRNVAVATVKTAETTGKLFWGVFGALFLGMCAAIGGGLLGVARREVVVTR